VSLHSQLSLLYIGNVFITIVDPGKNVQLQFCVILNFLCSSLITGDLSTFCCSPMIFISQMAKLQYFT
jgi:hypothetical protein